MSKTLRVVGLILIVFVCLTALFACNTDDKDSKGQNPETGGAGQNQGEQNTDGSDTEFVLTDYKTTLEMNVGLISLVFYGLYTEDTVYYYQLDDDNEKTDETYEIKIGEDWYLYEKNSFGYWKRTLTDNPYDDNIDIKKEDFYLDSDDYYAIKPDKLEQYSDMFNDFDSVDVAGIRVKFNSNELPDELLMSIYSNEIGAYMNAKMTFQYNTGETFDVPEQYVSSHNLKITSISDNSPSSVYCFWIFDNVSYEFKIDEGSGLVENLWMEVDVYGVWAAATWYNNSWEYNYNNSPVGRGFNMINVIELIDFADFVEDDNGLTLKPSRLNEYAEIILYDANPDLYDLISLNLKTDGGRITEMTYSFYFDDEWDNQDAEMVNTTLIFEYDALSFEDLP